jgi:hypothetical protein
MKKLLVYSIITVALKVSLYIAAAIAMFLVSKPIGIFAITATVLGFLVEELKYRERVKLEEKATGEFMQMLASKTGQGSC